MVVTRLLLSTLVVSLLILIILLIKKVFYNHLSQQTHYKIWYFLFAPIITYVIPWDFLQFREIFQYMQNFLFIEKDITKGNERFSGLGISQTSNYDLLNDFSISVNKTNTEFFQQFFLVIWITGIMFFIGSAIYANYQIRQIKKSSTSIKDQKINEMLEECKEVVGVKRKIILLETALITSPITLGLWKPYVFLPQKPKKNSR
ncbi:M56 family metallopeptidase [Niallia circulans]